MSVIKRRSTGNPNIAVCILQCLVDAMLNKDIVSKKQSFTQLPGIHKLFRHARENEVGVRPERRYTRNRAEAFVESITFRADTITTSSEFVAEMWCKM